MAPFRRALPRRTDCVQQLAHSLDQLAERLRQTETQLARLAAAFHRAPRQTPTPPPPVGCLRRDAVLTDRELQIASLFVAELSDKRIARQLGVAVQTVRNHVAAVMKKLRVQSRAELLVRLLSGPAVDPPHESPPPAARAGQRGKRRARR